MQHSPWQAISPTSTQQQRGKFLSERSETISSSGNGNCAAAHLQSQQAATVRK
jgi:hypothetical protein